jgi:hypothetical protein
MSTLLLDQASRKSQNFMKPLMQLGFLKKLKTCLSKPKGETKKKMLMAIL